MNILLCTPPLTQLNTPYPATAYLKGFLNQYEHTVSQADLGIEMILQLFTRKTLNQLFDEAEKTPLQDLSDNSKRMISLKEEYLKTIEPVIGFLQHRNPTLAYKITAEEYLPQASRFSNDNDLEIAFGNMGLNDKARHLATMYLEDLGDLIIETVSPHFGFSRYAESIAMAATSFEPIEESLGTQNTIIEQTLLQVLEKHLSKNKPNAIGFTVPFPGNLFGALLCAKYIKEHHPEIKIIMGGGYVNTELRNLNDPNVFKYIDFITLDDGEGPFLYILEYLEGKCKKDVLQRTFCLENGKVEYIDNQDQPNIPHTAIGTPDYSGLPLTDYLSLLEMLNPMHRLWSDGRWNKLTIAHGCYWKRCSFCDITLDYINRYEEAPATLLVDRIEQIIKQTGTTGFHFVDEAAPPLALRDLAVELIRRQVSISWWTNIRFEKTFTPDLCRLLAESGCIAVSGGLEVASDRLLALMEKGVTISQVARVTDGFTEAGIMVHAYLMYGFPTQTEQETLDSLEVVRQLFLNGCIQSGFWHRFTMTAHSPVGKFPERYGVVKTGPDQGLFAYNDLQHDDPQGATHDLYTNGLNTALYNYMHGVGLEELTNYWFDFEVPDASHSEDLIAEALEVGFKPDIDCKTYRIYWIGGKTEIVLMDDATSCLTFYSKKEEVSLTLPNKVAEFLNNTLPQLRINNSTPTSLDTFLTDYQEVTAFDENDLLYSKEWHNIRSLGLVLVRF